MPPVPITSPGVNGHTHARENNGVDASTERLQIVNDQKQFTSELNDQIARWGLRDAGFGYNLVSVFGSQSTGKSTLLNKLFGTTFDVMDESKRQQTTKGIWMCRGKGMEVMVMDVEGTDGRERGEDQDFERKSALFSLASSEVLIVNMWEHQVGLYQGANMALLKTVFEVNLALFGGSKSGAQPTRTLLLFVIRDHIGSTPLPNLAATIRADVQKIWESIAKPPDLLSGQKELGDWFDLDFVGLPHKIWATDKFEEEVTNLRRRFVDKGTDAYLFKPGYHKRIPADGVAFYMEGIWEQVQSNKDLDLPTQQELLAQFRCDEISAGALNEFTEQAKSQKRPVESGKVVEGLGEMMREWRSAALTRYDGSASRYHAGVYKRKRAELIASIDAILTPLFFGQLKNLHKSCLAAFKKALTDGLKGEGYNFAEVVQKARGACETRFSQGAKEVVVVGKDEPKENGGGEGRWEWEDELTLLTEEMAGVADLCRKDETKKMVNLIEKNFKKQISEPVELYLNKGEQDMWDHVLKTFRDTLEKAESAYLSKAISFNCTEDENAHSLAALRKRAWQAVRAKIDEQTADTAMLAKLRTHFEERFRYDESGVPRVWKPEDDIDGAFKVAKDQTLDLIPRYAKISPIDETLSYTLPPDTSSSPEVDEEFDFESSLIIFSETKSHELSARFRKDADAYYVEAKRSTVASIAQIPYWMYGVLVVLGWNEAMIVLFNPLYITFVLFALAAAYTIIKLGLTGPLFRLTQTVGAEIQNQATNRLREHFSQPVLNQPIEARRNSTDSDNREDMAPRTRAFPS